MSGTVLRLHRLEPGRLTMRIAGNIEGIEAGQQALRNFLESNSSSERALYRAELAYDELVSNVIKYAYPEGAAGDIDFVVGFEGDDIVLSIEDDGPAFNPLEVAAPEMPTSLEDAPVGGRGLMLVRKVAKKFEYQRRASRNRVRVTIARE